jgi:hypothetical protein
MVNVRNHFPSVDDNSKMSDEIVKQNIDIKTFRLWTEHAYPVGMTKSRCLLSVLLSRKATELPVW